MFYHWPTNIESVLTPRRNTQKKKLKVTFNILDIVFSYLSYAFYLP